MQTEVPEFLWHYSRDSEVTGSDISKTCVPTYMAAIMAATLRADVLFGLLIIHLVFYVKKPSFVVPDGVSITVRKEDLYNV